MLPVLLITLRETIEAGLIIATIVGILLKLKQTQHFKQIWFGASCGFLVTVVLVVLNSLLGFRIQQSLNENVKELFEGVMMIITAIFITWAIFWLHKSFAKYKLDLLQKLKQNILFKNNHTLFWLTFMTVFREGMEIVFFLATVYLSYPPLLIMSGFGIGFIIASGIVLLAVRATLKFPIYRTFQITTLLLILFAAGLGGRGIGSFVELGILPRISEISLPFLPGKNQIVGSIIHSIFGLENKMQFLELGFYALYIFIMRYKLYIKPKTYLINN